jgi:hypothetical protein
MCRKLICLFTFIFVLGTASNALAELVGYWRLDEGSGTIAYDSSGNGHDGTIKGDPQWVAGRNGLALDFDGTEDYIDIGLGAGDYFATLNSGLTVAGWIVREGTGTYDIVFGAGRNPVGTTAGDDNNGWKFGIDSGDVIKFTTLGILDYTSSVGVPLGEWVHIAATFNEAGTEAQIYLNGNFEQAISGNGPANPATGLYAVGFGGTWALEFFDGMLDEVRVYNHVLTGPEILAAMEGGKGYPFALGPSPEDGALHADTWVSLGWKAGDFAVSHDIYLGNNFDDVNNGTGDTFRGNQALTYFVAGFPGFAYPDGLVPGTTYYWRIDEVNDADPNSPWKGDVWSFSIPPKTAYFPVPADGAEFVDLNVQLTWTKGFGAKLHYIIFGEDYDVVSNAVMGVPNGTTTYNPGLLKLAKTYYWRVDEFDGAATHKGEVWSFTTLGAVSGPNPSDGAVDVKPSVVLGWDAGAVAALHDVYFGSDAEAVANATKASPEYKGPKALGEENYAPGKLTLSTTYYWRIDEVNDASADSPWSGNVWSFTTGDFFVIDDFEDYDANDNQIWYAWHDGLGYGALGTANYFAGNGTGAAVGDETTASYTEENIIYGGNQSMPVNYDNNKQGYSKYSEVECTLTNQRGWTEQGVTELSLWFRGYPASVGSFVEAPAGTFTMTASGADIWNVNGVEADEFHFAYKTLTGAGSIVAKVQSIDNMNGWAKAGVMIRESLNPDSAHAFACVTPSNGVASQGRPSTGGTSFNYNQTGVTAPYWVKLERSISGNFTVSHSSNGTSWQAVTGATPQNIPMGSNVYIGLALTAHDAALTCQAVFSNVTTTGTVTGQWAHQDIGIMSNEAEPLYVAVSNSAGNPVVVVHDDPAAAQIDTWTEWVIPLQTFADQGINLTNVDRIAIGLGAKGNMTTAGGSGKIFIDDIRLYRPAPELEPEPQP